MKSKNLGNEERELLTAFESLSLYQKFRTVLFGHNNGLTVTQSVQFLINTPDYEVMPVRKEDLCLLSQPSFKRH